MAKSNRNRESSYYSSRESSGVDQSNMDGAFSTVTAMSDVALFRGLKSTQVRLSQMARALPLRSDLHIARKVWHIVTGLAIIACYMGGLPQTTCIAILSSIFVGGLGLEVVRLRNPELNEKLVRTFGVLMRSHEVNRISGMPYYVASSVLAIAIFPRPVAILSLLYLALGDPLASLFGILYRERSVKIFNGKSLHGTAAGYVVCALATWIYLRSTGMHGLDLIRLTLLGGFAGALAELLPLDLDDNLTIPMVSGFIMWLGFVAIQFV